jgi:uncharacterized protein (TIGR04255 family)
MSRLPNAPLQEVIFEVKWDLTLDASTRSFTDPGFELAVGKFHGQLQADFPVSKQKLPDQIPQALIGHQIKHQFWKGEGVWPVVQLGPGIMAVNETDTGYDWKSGFFPLIKRTLATLTNAYGGELTFTNYSLRYIDTVRIADYGFTDWSSFLASNINIHLSNNFNTRGPLKNFAAEQAFDMGQDGTLQVVLSSGENEKKEDTFVWQTVISGQENIQQADLEIWIDKAHRNTSDIFKEICKPDFYGSFSRK